MHPIKAKRIGRLAAQLRSLGEVPQELRDKYPALASIVAQSKSMAQELQTLSTAGLNPPHAGPNDQVLAAENPGLSGVLKHVVEKLGDKVALAGGMAVVHWVDVRKTLDLDFAVLGADLKSVEDAFPGGETLDLIYSVKVSGVDVDFLLPIQETPWTSEAVKNAKTERVLDVPVRILTPEYLILYKFYAGRERDMSDIESLMTLPGVVKKARTLVEQYLPGELEDFESIALIAEYNLR